MAGETKFLCLRANWLANEYHGEDWPPSPARVYQALVGGLMTGANRHLAGDSAEDALRWLERLPAPRIVVQHSRPLGSYRIAVPNNDLDKPARSWAKGKHEDTAKYRTMKEVKPRRMDSEGPHVSYWWDLGAGQGSEHIAALRQVSHCLHTFGWGRDMAYADLEVKDEFESGLGEVWRPSAGGKNVLSVPVAGFLDDLKAVYQRFVRRAGVDGINADTRPSVYALERYDLAVEAARPMAAFQLLDLDTERDKPFAYIGRRSQDVAAWVRHAANEAIKREPQWVPEGEYVSGHVMEGDRNRRLSFVPLPSVGHRHTDGMIRRVVIWEPSGEAGEVTEYLQRTLSGAELRDEQGRVRCRLAPLRESDPVLARYRGKATRWKTVTPVVLHGFNSVRGEISLKKTDQLLEQAFAESGYPKELVKEVYIQQAPLVANTPAAKDIWRARHLMKWPCYHVGVEFTTKVEGPVLVGIGRHYGFGLFVPMVD